MTLKGLHIHSAPYLSWEVDVDQVRLGPIRLPVSVISIIPQQLHTIACLGAGDTPYSLSAHLTVVQPPFQAGNELLCGTMQKS